MAKGYTTVYEHRQLMVKEVHRQEEAARCQSGLTSPARQLDEVGWHKIKWSDLWNMDTNRLSFIIRATHAVLPSPTDLHLWYGEDPACHQCAAPATLKHILVGVKNSLTQGRYTWRHKLVLRCLATALEDKRVSISVISLDAQTAFPQLTPFIQEGEKPCTKPSSLDSCQLNIARYWEMRVDLNQRITFPLEITVTNLPGLQVFASSLWNRQCLGRRLSMRLMKGRSCGMPRWPLKQAGLDGASSGCGKQGLCSQFHHKAARGSGYQRPDPVESN